jgi:hypothetical protein
MLNNVAARHCSIQYGRFLITYVSDGGPVLVELTAKQSFRRIIQQRNPVLRKIEGRRFATSALIFVNSIVLFANLFSGTLSRQSLLHSKLLARL